MCWGYCFGGVQWWARWRARLALMAPHGQRGPSAGLPPARLVRMPESMAPSWAVVSSAPQCGHFGRRRYGRLVGVVVGIIDSIALLCRVGGCARGRCVFQHPPFAGGGASAFDAVGGSPPPSPAPPFRGRGGLPLGGGGGCVRIPDLPCPPQAQPNRVCRTARLMRWQASMFRDGVRRRTAPWAKPARRTGFSGIAPRT